MIGAPGLFVSDKAYAGGCSAGYYTAVTTSGTSCEKCPVDYYCPGLSGPLVISAPKYSCAASSSNNGTDGVYPSTWTEQKSAITDCVAKVSFNGNGSSAYPAHAFGGSTTSVISLGAHYSTSSSYVNDCQYASSSMYYCKSKKTNYYITDLPTPTRNGYTFKDWKKCDSDGTSNCSWAYGGSSYTYTGNTYFFAQWQNNTYTISYTLNGGALQTGDTNRTSYSPDWLQLNGQIKLKNPVRQGYHFDGWCENSGLTTNCETEKIIPVGAFGNKSYYAKWSQVTGTKTMMIYCGSSDIKTKTTTGNSFSMGKASTECSTSDKREYWICGDVDLVDASFSNIHDYHATSSTNASVPVSNSLMFCTPALKLKTNNLLYQNNLYWIKYNSDASTGYARVTPLTDNVVSLDSTFTLSNFCATAFDGWTGTTYWWYGPNEYDNSLFSTTCSSVMSSFKNKTSTVTLDYGYKVDIKCTVDATASDFTVVVPDGRNLRDYTVALCNKKYNDTIYDTNNYLYCKVNTGDCSTTEFEYASSGGMKKALSTKAACPSTYTNKLPGDSTCYYKAAWCNKGNYFFLNDHDASSTPCWTCSARDYCDACDANVEDCGATKKLYFDDPNSSNVQGSKSCVDKTGFYNSANGSDERQDCYTGVWVGNGISAGHNSFLSVHYGTSSNAYTLLSNGNFKLNSLPGIQNMPAADTTGYKLYGWRQSDYYDNNAVPLSDISAAYVAGTPSWTSNMKVTTNTMLSGSDNVYLRAMWEPITYNIAFDSNANGTTGSTATMTDVYYGAPSSYSLTANGFNNPGYNFVGWCVGATTCNDNERLADGATLSSDLTTTDGATITLYAQWALTFYTIMLNANGGILDSGVVNPISYNIESGTVNLPDDPDITQTGYTFDGWCESVDCNGGNETPITQFIPTPSNIGYKTYYAQWTPIDYTITYETNGGSQVSSNTYDITDTQPNGYTLPTTTKTGYAFGGWCVYDSEQIPAVTTCDNPVYALAAGTTGMKWAYAKWAGNTYTITYNTNGGSAVLNAAYDITDTQPDGYALPTTSKTGYAFDGWCVYDSEQTPAVTTCSNSVYTLASGTTGNKWAYAKWTADSITVHFDGNQTTNNSQGNVSGTKTDETCIYDSATCNLSNVYNPPYTINKGFSRTGHTFAGWNTASDGSGLSVAATYNTTPNSLWPYVSNGEVTLYAQWTPNIVIVTLDDHYGYTSDDDTNGLPLSQPASPSAIYIKYGVGFFSDSACTQQITSVTLPTTPTGYTFGGFRQAKYSNAGLVMINTSGTITALTTGYPSVANGGSVTWYPRYNANVYVFTLNKNANDAVNTGATTSIYEKYNTGWYKNYAATTAISSPDNLVIAPTRNGYLFGGYYRCAQTTGGTDCEQIIANDGTLVANVKTDIVGNGTLYAKWMVDTYTITYNADAGWCSGGDLVNHNCTPTSYTVESGTITLPTPIKTGYAFDGWYETSDFNGNAVATIPTGSTGNKTYYAKWIARVNLIWNPESADNAESVSGVNYCDVGSTFNVPVVMPTRTGYTFSGWDANVTTP